MSAQNEKRVTILFPDKTIKDIDRRAKDREMTRAALIRLIVKCWVNDNPANPS